MSRSFPRHTLGNFRAALSLPAGASPIPPSGQCGCVHVGTRENGTPPYEGTPGKNPGAESFAARSVSAPRLRRERPKRLPFANARRGTHQARLDSPGVRATRVPERAPPFARPFGRVPLSRRRPNPRFGRGSASSADGNSRAIGAHPRGVSVSRFVRPTSPPDSTRWRRGERRRASRPRKGPSRARRRIPARGGTVAGVRRTRTSRAGRSGVAPSAKTRVSGEMCARRMDAMRSEMSAGVTGLTGSIADCRGVFSRRERTVSPQRLHEPGGRRAVSRRHLLPQVGRTIRFRRAPCPPYRSSYFLAARGCQFGGEGREVGGGVAFASRRGRLAPVAARATAGHGTSATHTCPGSSPSPPPPVRVP